ncbi:trigger factor [Microbacterium sorbitolivorans]|uniref:Trigger factor n=1 Tax=Microbacterium sorbitolivorans TaxID=1867410 RepID=A0A367Y6P3_9MICO|nr:trigger factor [Microbacterium sorbitolivorans]RCK61508.1 trigger factor [Microbacterium sorbitolivorans]GGF31600.1 trigger factor [Microbacterium sorbitolivorans]
MVNTTVEKLSPTRVKLHISVTPEELKPSIDHAYEHIAKDVQVPGFRKGKVPAPIIDQRVGRGAVIEHAVNEGLDRFFREAVATNELQVLGQPSADITAWPAEKDFSGDLEVDIEVDVAPEFEVPAFDGLKITVDAIEVDEAGIDAELDTLRARFGTLVPVERPAAKGDFVELDLVAKIGDEEIDRAEGVSYEIGSGQLLEGTDEAIESLTAGEETTYTSKLVGGERAGEDAEVTVVVKAVKERELPEADDDFAQMASEFDTIAELRESLTEQVKQKGAFTQGSEARDKLVEQLLEAADIAVPEALVEDEVHRHLEQENRLEDDTHRAEVKEASEKQFRTQLLFDRIAKDLDVQVSQDEFTQYLIQASSQYGMSPQDFIQALQQGNQLQAIMGDVARNKAIAVVLGKAEVVDTNGDAVNLDGFVAVEEDEESEAEESAEDEK